MAELTAREKIVSTASDLYYRNGIGAVGMDAVRDAAGVSLRALYKEFASKEALVLAVLEFRHDLWERALADNAAGLTDPTDTLLSMFDYLAQWTSEPDFRGCGFVNAFGELGPASPLIARYVREHKRSVQAYIEDLVVRSGRAPELAAQIALLAEGAQTTAAIEGDNGPAIAARAAAVALLAAADAHA